MRPLWLGIKISLRQFVKPDFDFHDEPLVKKIRLDNSSKLIDIHEAPLVRKAWLGLKNRLDNVLNIDCFSRGLAGMDGLIRTNNQSRTPAKPGWFPRGSVDNEFMVRTKNQTRESVKPDWSPQGPHIGKEGWIMTKNQTSQFVKPDGFLVFTWPWWKEMFC